MILSGLFKRLLVRFLETLQTLLTRIEKRKSVPQYKTQMWAHIWLLKSPFKVENQESLWCTEDKRVTLSRTQNNDVFTSQTCWVTLDKHSERKTVLIIDASWIQWHQASECNFWPLNPVYYLYQVQLFCKKKGKKQFHKYLKWIFLLEMVINKRQ